jgi:hypothetical protein
MAVGTERSDLNVLIKSRLREGDFAKASANVGSTLALIAARLKQLVHKSPGAKYPTSIRQIGPNVTLRIGLSNFAQAVSMPCSRWFCALLLFITEPFINRQSYTAKYLATFTGWSC